MIILYTAMTIPTKQNKRGVMLPVYGMGTWSFGGKRTHDSTNDDESNIASMVSCFKAGVRHVDTAELYADGYAERLVGEAIRRSGVSREDFFVTSKVAGDCRSRNEIREACEASLRRLGFKYLDLYLLHWRPECISLQDSIEALNELVDQGLVKHIGVSNFSRKSLEQAERLSKAPIFCDQVHYSLKVREVEQDGLPEYCREQGIFLVAYRPLEKGLFAEDTPAILYELSSKYGKTPTQIALNWLVSKPYVVALAKTSDSRHLEENLGAFGWNLDPADIERLSRDFPEQETISSVRRLG